MLTRCAILLLFSAAALPAQTPEKYGEALGAIQGLIEREQRDAGIPGIAIAIVQDQTLLWSRGFGDEDFMKFRATTRTLFRVGSVSKLFTDLAAMQLVEEGKMDLDVPVTKYLPEFKPANRSAKPITLRQLMAHRSGLVRESPVGNVFDTSAPSLEKTVASLNGVPLVYDPEAKIKHSNAAIAAVGLAVEKVDGRPFAKAVRERVFGPIGMTHADFEPTPEVKRISAQGHMWTYHGREFPAPTFDLGIGPAAGMYATPDELAQFMSVLFAEGKGLAGRLVKPETLKEMLTPQFAPAGAKRGFGLGFVLDELDGHKRAGHSGAIYGFVTELQFLPEEKLGIVIIANKDTTDWLVYRLAEEALRQLLAVKTGKPLPKLPDRSPVSRDEARKLAGRYGEEGQHELIEAEGKLFHYSTSGDRVAEVWKQNGRLVELGAHGSGTEFTCNGSVLTWPATQGQSFARRKEPDGAPAEPAAHFRGLIGEYGWDHNTLFVLEKDARLWALIDWLFLYPLEEESKDAYKFPTTVGLFDGEKLVFRRDARGKATEVAVGPVVFPRRRLDGEDGRTFRIKPLRPVEELRKEAMAATPPEERGDFRKADLVELTALDRDIMTDLRYASDNNFMGTPLYPKTAKAYMQRPAAEALVRVNKALAEKGYGLWVFDAYRPWSVTKMFWEATPEKMRMFVADPSKGSRHNRGCAVDLSLYDRKTGKPVEMVSGFDEFSDRAYPNYWGGTSRQRWHRQLLRWSMEDQGFTVYEAEWWHFDFKDWKSYRIGNQSFEELQK